MTTIPITQQSTAREQRATLRRSLRIPLIIIGVFLVTALIIFLASPQQSDKRFAPNNPTDDGAMALAEVLNRNGVSIEFVEQKALAEDLARPGATVLIANDPGLDAGQYERILGSGADVVLLSPDTKVVEFVSDTANLGIEMTAGYPDDSTPAQCTLPAAIAAAEVSPSYSVFDYPFTETMDQWDEDGNQLAPEGATACFPQSWGWQLLQAQLPNSTVVTMLFDSNAWTNSKITEFGNAALALHLLGENDNLVWFLPTLDPPSSIAEDGQANWPLWFSLIMAVAAVTVIFVALWQGRRFGPIVTEKLPVVVKASETTRGRGGLYRRAGAQEHAAGTLRSGTATRLAARLGVATSSQSRPLVTAVTHATKHSEQYVQDLFYGPAPTNDIELTALAQKLADLESEINA